MSRKKRPTLWKGDLVKLKRGSSELYRVTGYTTDTSESHKLGHRGRRLPSNDGACMVHTSDSMGRSMTFRRRELWKIPEKDQPRHRSRFRRR